VSLGTVTELVSGFIEGIINFFVTLYDDLVGNSIIPDMLTDIINSFIENLAIIILTIVGFVTDLISQFTGIDLATIGSDIIGGLLGGLESAWDDVTSWLSDAADDVSGFFTDALGIRSPSTVFEKIGINIMKGLESGLENSINLPMVPLNNTINMMKDNGGGKYSTMPYHLQSQGNGSCTINFNGDFYINDEKDIDRLARRISIEQDKRKSRF
jgi:phage-related protein